MSRLLCCHDAVGGRLKDGLDSMVAPNEDTRRGRDDQLMRIRKGEIRLFRNFPRREYGSTTWWNHRLLGCCPA